MTTARGTATTPGGGRVERHGWTLFPLALIAYAVGGVALIGFLAQAWFFVDAIGSTDPVLLQLRPFFELPAAAGTHHYFGGAYVADGMTVTATGAQAEVSGVPALTRALLKLGPMLWSATIAVVGASIGFSLARLRARDPDRSAARPMVVAAVALAIGSTAAQLASAAGFTGVGDVAWDGRGGMDGFTAAPDTLFDFTPVAVSVALLAIVLVIRRGEPAPAPRAGRRRRRAPVAPAGDDFAAAARADAEGAW